MNALPFQELVDDHASSVYRFLVATVGFGDAEDCFQETFLAALRAWPTLADSSNLGAWVLTIAYHKAVDARRAGGRRPVPSEVVPDRSAEAPPLADADLWELVGALPPKQREAVLRRFVADLPYADIALAMACSEAAARRNVFEGVKKLRESWHDD